MKRKTGIIGVNDKLGIAILDEIIQKDGRENLIGLGIDDNKYLQNDIEFRHFNFYKKKSLYNSFFDIDTLLLCTPHINLDKRLKMYQLIIQIVKEIGVRKIVYTSIIGPEQGTLYSPIVQINRTIEKWIQNAGVDWVIGRNGPYLEPEIESIEEYIQNGEIVNPAFGGRCAYTIKSELAAAYYNMLVEDRHNGSIYNLSGKTLTQSELADLLSRRFDIVITYRGVSFEEYYKEKRKELGPFLGEVAAGIYQSIQKGYFDVKNNDYAVAAGREHISWDDYIFNI